MYKNCNHQLTFRGLCCNCGFDTTTIPEKVDKIKLDFLCPGVKANNKQFVLEKIFKQDHKMMLQNKKLRLVIDLDETLIHSKEISKVNEKQNNVDTMDFEYCSETQSITFTSHRNPIAQPESFLDCSMDDDFDDDDENVHVFKVGNTKFKTYFRPYVMEFLSEISRYYELYVYTNGTTRYAKTVLDILCKKMSEKGLELNIAAILARSKRKEKVSKRLHKMLCKRSFSLIIDDQPGAWCQGLFFPCFF